MKAGLIKGNSTHVEQKLASFARMLLLHTLRCHTGECCNKRKSIFWQCSHVQGYCTLERDALCQRYCISCRGIAFSTRDTAQRKVRHLECTLHPSKGMVYLLKDFLFRGILFLQKHTGTLHCSKGRLRLLRRVCCISVWILHFLKVWVCYSFYSEDI